MGTRHHLQSAGTAAALGAAFAVSLALFASAALATTYHANKLGDHAPNGCTANDCTLREAVIAGNAHPGGDQIVLRGGKAYQLALVGTDDDATHGDLDLNGDSVKLLSSTRRPASIDANGIDRVFDVSPLSPTNATFKLLKIKGGSTAGSADGGGINVSAGTARVVKSTVAGNATASGFGGGINLDDGDGVVVQSTVSGNSSKFAGGIAVH